jgi:hypothetical protein
MYGTHAWNIGYLIGVIQEVVQGVEEGSISAESGLEFIGIKAAECEARLVAEKFRLSITSYILIQLNILMFI